MALVTLLMLPFCIILQIITFIIKIFSKDKVKKDWIILFVNFVSIIIQSAILVVFFVFMTNPLLEFEEMDTWIMQKYSSFIQNINGYEVRFKQS